MAMSPIDLRPSTPRAHLERGDTIVMVFMHLALRPFPRSAGRIANHVPSTGFTGTCLEGTTLLKPVNLYASKPNVVPETIMYKKPLVFRLTAFCLQYFCVF